MKEFFNNKKLEILTISIMIVCGTLMHFVCDIFSNDIVVKILGVIFPVNESSWEHMKMLWYPFLVAGIVLSHKEKNPGYFGAFVISGIVAMLTIIGCFAFYQSFTTTSVLIIDIISFMLVMIFCGMLAFHLSKEEWLKKQFIFWFVCSILVTALLIYLTYCPGPGYLFLDDEGLEG